MSEAIEQECQCCHGTGRLHSAYWEADCGVCDDTGRVPDVEATLRAEVARLTEDNAYLKGECDEFHAQVKRMGAGMQEEHLAHQAEIARLTAEVERLKGREREAADMMRNDEPGCWRCPACDKWAPDDASTRLAAWLAGCKS